MSYMFQIYFMYCWIQLVKLLLRIFEFLFISNILLFLFLWIMILGSDIGVLKELWKCFWKIGVLSKRTSSWKFGRIYQWSHLVLAFDFGRYSLLFWFLNLCFLWFKLCLSFFLNLSVLWGLWWLKCLHFI